MIKEVSKTIKINFRKTYKEDPINFEKFRYN